MTKAVVSNTSMLRLSVLLCTLITSTFGFVTPDSAIQHKFYQSTSEKTSNVIAHAKRDRNNSDKGTQSVAAGAILGGLLGGPFGLLFGAQIGANVGRQLQNQQDQKDEMERLGITPEMLQMAEECGVALERAMEGLDATRDSLESLQKLARRLDETNNDLYEKAQAEIVNGNEDAARNLLLERQNVQEKLKKTLMNCKDEKVRFEKMEKNVEAIEERAMEVDSLLKRTVGAKAFQDSNDNMGMVDSFRIEDEDPLLRKFKELEKE